MLIIIWKFGWFGECQQHSRENGANILYKCLKISILRDGIIILFSSSLFDRSCCFVSVCVCVLLHAVCDIHRIRYSHHITNSQTSKETNIFPTHHQCSNLWQDLSVLVASFIVVTYRNACVKPQFSINTDLTDW